MHEKLKTDIGSLLFNLRQGYLNHITYCDNLERSGESLSVVLGDNLNYVKSKELHLQFVQELDALLVSIGLNPTGALVEPVIEKVVNDAEPIPQIVETVTPQVADEVINQVVDNLINVVTSDNPAPVAETPNLDVQSDVQ